MTSFQDNNQILLIREDTNGNVYKFRDSYTITIYNCHPNGLNGNELYINLNSHDDALTKFLHEILVSIGIMDGSIEKTIIDDTMITLIHDDKVKFYKERSHGRAIISKKHINLLGQHYHIVENNTLTIKLIAENFKIISGKYLEMNFQLKELILERNQEQFGFPNMGGMDVGTMYSLEDYLKEHHEIIEAPDSMLNQIYRGKTDVKIRLLASHK